jgi:hypothetical protein
VAAMSPMGHCACFVTHVTPGLANALRQLEQVVFASSPFTRWLPSNHHVVSYR